MGFVLDHWPMTIEQMNAWAQQARTAGQCADGLHKLNSRVIVIRRAEPREWR